MPAMRGRLVLLIAAAAAAAAAAREVVVDLPTGGRLGLSTRGATAFRVRFLTGEDRSRRPLDSPMVAPRAPDAPFVKVDDLPGGVGRGIRSAIGALTVTSAGELELRDVGGRVLTKSEPVAAGKVAVALSSTPGAKLYGGGTAREDAMRLSKSAGGGHIVNKATYVPYYYSTDGYAALGVTDSLDHNVLQANYTLEDARLSWNSTGGAFELHLMPAASLRTATAAYLALTGGAQVPPRYAFGFAASKWGWKDRSDIEETLTKFRGGRFPADSFIVDFEWFANGSDYDFKPEGSDEYQDFGYNNVTFSEPRKQLLDYKERLGFRMGGIRKPRLGNSIVLKKAQTAGWMAPPGGPETYAKDRWLSFEDPAMRRWYGAQNAHYLDEGVDFWWNDEGENNYFTYHWWNVAESDMLHASGGGESRKRFYSLNRAFSPGMARLGAAVWSGDIDSTWQDLERTPGTMVKWGLAGAPYVACDIGGFFGNKYGGNFTPELLTRWYQVGIFLPIMRVHSTLGETPHFPWLFGERAAGAMRAALELRYRLVPYHYSLAHAMSSEGALWMHPLVMDYPDDPEVAELSTQWMDGDILVAPVLRSDSAKQVYLPAGTWYELRTGGVVSGPARIEGPADFDEVPAYVRAGGIVTLAPVIQSTEELPGGPLEVQVHAGADGAFVMVEDDGETMAYDSGSGVRRTTFVWDDLARTLHWSSGGAAAPPHAFTHMSVVLRHEGGERRSELLELTATGSVRLAADRRLAESPVHV